MKYLNVMLVLRLDNNARLLEFRYLNAHTVVYNRKRKTDKHA